MNYKKIYENLMKRSKNRITQGYTEKHHIIPKCIGGNNSEDNIVILYPEEHYVAHQLLAKIYPTHSGLIFAAFLMSTHDTDNRINNKQYGWLKRKLSIAKKEYFRLHPRVGSHMSGKKHNEETKKRISESSKRSLRKLHEKNLYCFDLRGNLIKEFKNISEAAEFANTSASNIKYCAEGKFRHIKGFMWSYNIKAPDAPKTIKVKNRKIQTPNGIFNNCTEVMKYYNLPSTTTIRRRCLSSKEKWKEWKYIDGPEAFDNDKRNKI